MTHKRWTAKERVDIVVEFLSTNIGVAEVCRKYAISPTTFDNWRKRFMDAGRRELAGIGGSSRNDPAKALARENESLKIVVREQALALAELKKAWRWGEGEYGQENGEGRGEPCLGAKALRRLAPSVLQEAGSNRQDEGAR